MLETLGGPLPIHPELINAKLLLMDCKWNDLENPKPSMYSKTVVSAQKEYLTLLTLSDVNGKKSGGLKDKLENESLFGHDSYPEDQA